MNQLYVEKHVLEGQVSLSRVLALDIHSRINQGKMAVVTDKPVSLLSSTRKEWLKLIRRLAREKSSTLEGAQINRLSWQIAAMQNITFSAKPPEDQLEADITFATADDFIYMPPVCSVAYITGFVSKEKQHMLTSWMPPHSLVVLYESPEFK